MSISREMMARVAHADVMLDGCLFLSVARLIGAAGNAALWHSEGQSTSLMLKRHHGTILDGNRPIVVSAPDGGAIHVYGDLCSEISISGMCELVITGDVLAGARVRSSGVLAMFVGGRLLGEVEAEKSLRMWCDSNVSGVIKTGRPSADIRVEGDLEGVIQPKTAGGLLRLSVGGFASSEFIESSLLGNYVGFSGSIGLSDRPVGLYSSISGIARECHWCVLNEMPAS